MIKKYVSWIIIAYLRLAIITICNASIIAIDATIGKSNALSCDEPSSILPTESDINTTLSSRFELASDNDDPNWEVSCFRFANSVFVSSKIWFNYRIWAEIPLISWARTFVAPEPWEIFPSSKVTMWKTYIPSSAGK